MEEVEEANKAAVESCHRVLNLLSTPPQDQSKLRSLMAETGEAVFKFRKVVSLLNSSGLGHARVRKQLKKFQFQFQFQSQSQSSPFLPHTMLLENPPNCRTDLLQGKNLQMGPLCLSSNGKSSLQQAQSASAHYHHFLQQQQQTRVLLQNNPQAEMMYHLRGNNSGINLNFDSSSCTHTMSSTRSFISSLSIDGSVANLDGSGAFHLIGAPRSSDQNSHHKRKCSGRGEDGSVKCGSSGRCHCSKKRLGSCGFDIGMGTV